MATAHKSLQSLRPIEDRQKLDKIIDAISSIDNSEFSDRSQADSVSALSANTVFDAIEVSPETIFETSDDRFKASAIVYVTLNYGGKRDGVSMPDSYPAVVEGKIVKGKVSVDRILVDTSSFYS